jgi:ABC-type proline/glycine betaine transport system permease subunit
VSRVRPPALSLLVLMFMSACSPMLEGIRSTLVATEAGTTAFASAGTIGQLASPMR